MNIPILSKPVHRNRFLKLNNKFVSAVLMSNDDEDDDDGYDGDDDGYDGDDDGYNDDGGDE